MKILFAGEGGQGVQAAAEILARAAFKEGKQALYIPNFGVEQRGGVSLAFVVIDQQAVVYPKFKKADFVAILSPRSEARIQPYLNKNTKIIRVQSNLPTKVWNIVALGKLNQQGKIVKKASLAEIMEKQFAIHYQKKPELRELNLSALNE